MKKDNLLILAAVAAIGYALWKILGKSTTATNPQARGLTTQGTGAAPLFYGLGGPIAGVAKPPSGGGKEGGAQAGAAIDLGALIDAGKDLYKFVAGQFGKRATAGAQTPITQTVSGPDGQIYYNTGNAYIPSGLYTGPGGDIYQDTGNAFVPTQLPASQPTFDYTPTIGAPGSIFDQPQYANA